MNQIFIALTVLFIIGMSACNQKQNDNKAVEIKTYNPAAIEGNWITVAYELNGKLIKPKRYPQQFKMFNDGYFL